MDVDNSLQSKLTRNRRQCAIVGVYATDHKMRSSWGRECYFFLDVMRRRYYYLMHQTRDQPQVWLVSIGGSGSYQLYCVRCILPSYYHNRNYKVQLQTNLCNNNNKSYHALSMPASCFDDTRTIIQIGFQYCPFSHYLLCPFLWFLSDSAGHQHYLSNSNISTLLQLISYPLQYIHKGRVCSHCAINSS